MDEVNLLLKYPLVQKYIEGGVTIYRGSINVNDEDYKISITNLEDSYKLILPEKLIAYTDQIEHDAELSTKNILQILDNLCMAIASTLPSNTVKNHCDIYKHVLYEYAEFSKFYLNLKLCSISSDLSKIDVSIIDEQHREHFVEITVNFLDNEGIFKITTYDLPHNPDAFKKSSSLKVVYDQFLSAVEMLQPFFDLMETFDKNCWILDPAEPNRRCSYRRISLGENISAIITFDPLKVFKIPEIKFLGPERLVETYRTVLNNHLEEWNPKDDTFSEVLKLLGMDSFPQKPDVIHNVSDVLKENGDCSICFSLRLNQKLPEVVCKNKACENCYHTECLYEWLVSVNARRFFTEVIGHCPNCEKTISCPIPR